MSENDIEFEIDSFEIKLREIALEGDQAKIESFDYLKLREIHRELTAQHLARDLMKTFRYTLFGLLGLGFVVCGILLYEQIMGLPVQAGESLAKDVLVPFIGTVGTFASTLFGPLLAFVLGHYFSERSRK